LKKNEAAMKRPRPTESPFTESVPQLGKRLLGLGREASYEAAKTGIIPTIKVGRRLRGLSRVLEARLSRDPDQAA
jgi:hypothetical protein